MLLLGVDQATPRRLGLVESGGLAHKVSMTSKRVRPRAPALPQTRIMSVGSVSMSHV